MSLKQFQSKFMATDIQRPNRYRVTLTGPNGTNEQVDMLCENAQFPGQNMRTSTDDLRHGPVREIIHGTTYGPITLTFMCTAGMPEKKWFENWQTFMVERENAIMWQARYYTEYVGEIKMFSLDRKDRDNYSITIYEAFPKTITQQEFSYGSQNDYQRISVEFAYHHWVSELTPTPSAAGEFDGTPTTLPTNPSPEIRSTGSPTQPGANTTPSISSPQRARRPLATPAQPAPATPNPADQAAGF